MLLFGCENVTEFATGEKRTNQKFGALADILDVALDIGLGFAGTKAVDVSSKIASSGADKRILKTPEGKIASDATKTNFVGQLVGGLLNLFANTQTSVDREKKLEQ